MTIEAHEETIVDRVKERGASLVEYVLMIALIAIVCLSALSFFGGNSKNSVGHSTNCIIGASNGTPNCP